MTNLLMVPTPSIECVQLKTAQFRPIRIVAFRLFYCVSETSACRARARSIDHLRGGQEPT